MALSDKTPTCMEGGKPLPSPLARKSSSLPGDIPTNPSGVPRIVSLVGASSTATEVSAGQPEKCIQSCAISAGFTAPFVPRGDGPVYCSDCFSKMRS